MIRVRRGNVRIKKRKKLFNIFKGFKQSKTHISNKEQQFQSLFNQFIDRKLKKRKFKTYQIMLLNSVIQNIHMKIHNFFYTLKKYKIFLTKQILCIFCYTKFVIITLLIDLI